MKSVEEIKKILFDECELCYLNLQYAHDIPDGFLGKEETIKDRQAKFTEATNIIYLMGWLNEYVEKYALNNEF